MPSIPSLTSALFVIGLDNLIYQSTSVGWVEVAGGKKGIDIAVDSKNRPWIVGINNAVSFLNGTTWIEPLAHLAG